MKLFRTPTGRTAHLVSTVNPNETLCGTSTQRGFTWHPSDLPSGERNVFRQCNKCRHHL